MRNHIKIMIAVSLVAALMRPLCGADVNPAQAQAEDENANETYVIGADDIVHVTVEQHPEWSGDYIVGPRGRIIIPTVGEFKAAGMTRQEFEKALTEHLSKYIMNARVRATVVKYNSNVIYVLGEVNVPGKYSTEGRSMTLRDVIVRAGLPTRFAATGSVYIISPSQKRPSQTVINLYRILYRGELERDVVLKAGDIVYVPKNFFGKIYDLVSVLLGPISSVRAPVVP